MTGAGVLPDPQQRPFLTIREAATALACGERAVREAVRRGDLPAIRVGQIRIPTTALWHMAGLTSP